MHSKYLVASLQILEPLFNDTCEFIDLATCKPHHIAREEVFRINKRTRLKRDSDMSRFRVAASRVATKVFRRNHRPGEHVRKIDDVCCECVCVCVHECHVMSCTHRHTCACAGVYFRCAWLSYRIIYDPLRSEYVFETVSRRFKELPTEGHVHVDWCVARCLVRCLKRCTIAFSLGY